jgi:hypothetical protein
MSPVLEEAATNAGVALRRGRLSASCSSLSPSPHANEVTRARGGVRHARQLQGCKWKFDSAKFAMVPLTESARGHEFFSRWCGAIGGIGSAFPHGPRHEDG